MYRHNSTHRFCEDTYPSGVYFLVDSITKVTNGTRHTHPRQNNLIILLLNTHEISWRHMRGELLKCDQFEINSKLKILIQESYLL
jgi:hypothetical protein